MNVGVGRGEFSATAFSYPGLFDPFGRFLHGNDVHELTGTNVIRDDVSLRSQPDSHIRRDVVGRQPLRRDEGAPAHIASESRCVSSVNAVAHEGADAIAADNKIDLSLSAILEGDDRSLVG